MDNENNQDWEGVNPILTPLTAPRSSATSQRKPPAAIRAVLVEMAVPYRPTDPQKVARHLEQIDALAIDMADAPIANLKQVCADWRRTERYMPRAVDLWDRIKQGRTRSPAQADPIALQRRVELANARLLETGREDIQWVADPHSGGMAIAQVVTAPRSLPLSDDEVRALPRHLWSLGLSCGELTWDRLRLLGMIEQRREAA